MTFYIFFARLISSHNISNMHPCIHNGNWGALLEVNVNLFLCYIERKQMLAYKATDLNTQNCELKNYFCNALYLEICHPSSFTFSCVYTIVKSCYFRLPIFEELMLSYLMLIIHDMILFNTFFKTSICLIHRIYR